MYASVADARSEGVTVAEASDARLLTLLDEATRLIDRVTGWFFEPRSAIYCLDGRGTPSLELPAPPIRVERLLIDDADVSVESVRAIGAPVRAGFEGPRLTFRRRRRFPFGRGNIIVQGRFGFTEEDGTVEGRTPLTIRRACLLLVLGKLSPLASATSADARSQWRVIEERTRDQSIRFSAVESASAALTGDPEVDKLLAYYVRPAPIGAT